ncbi:hypothetical protein EPN81_03460 [Patescibacteria group bacterium]|nr:MAG: hypothetical protein EPN81_03460 [Patescibacteria group bacterium]
MFSLKRQLKKISKSIRPSEDFRTRLLLELSLAYDQEYGCPQRRPFLFRFAAVSLASLVLFFSMGAGVYAYESPRVMEGHPLYFVKSGLESIQGGFARSPEARAQFHAEMMERRLAEGEYQLPHRPDRVQPSLNEAAEQFEQTISALDEGVMDSAMREKFISALSLHRARYLELSARVQEDEEETGALEPLRQRIEGHELSEDELIRLFEMGRRARDQIEGR